MSHRSQTIMEAMSASPTLQALQLRSALGRSRMQVLQQLLPPTLCQQLRHGNCDPTDWCILSPNAAVAAKLRQWLPEINAQLKNTEHREVSIRVKIARNS